MIYADSPSEPKICRGITTHQFHTDLRPTEPPREQSEESKKELRLCESNKDWMSNGGIKPLNFFVSFETFKTL